MIGTARIAQISPVPRAIADLVKQQEDRKHAVRAAPAPVSARASAEQATGAKRRKKIDREGDEQTLLIARFEATYPKIAHLLIHIPNGGFRKNAFEGWRLRQQGVKAGVSDLFLPVARGTFHGLWIEFKAAEPYASPVTPAQQLWVEEMLAQGYHAQVARGADEGFVALQDYLANESPVPAAKK